MVHLAKDYLKHAVSEITLLALKKGEYLEEILKQHQKMILFFRFVKDND